MLHFGSDYMCGAHPEVTKKTKNLRGIDFAERFKDSCLYKELFLKHQNELFIGIRNNYLNIYYNGINIAKVSYLRSGEARCELNEYYFTGKSNSPVIVFKSEEEIRKNVVGKFDIIKKNSDKKTNLEKKSQEGLFIRNNKYANSEWYCTDVEWRKPYDAEHPDFNARFDIVAVSKSVPHRIAIIELKYGKTSFDGESGIEKHLQDFKKFQDYGYIDSFMTETAAIIRNREQLDTDFPQSLSSISVEDLVASPEFYVVTLNNNAESDHGISPQQKTERMKRMLGTEYPPSVTFLFSPLTLSELKEKNNLDILNDDMYKLPSKIAGTRYSVVKSSNFQESERLRQMKLLESGSEVFYGARSSGQFMGKPRKFCLARNDEHRNLFQGIVSDVFHYFKEEDITFWGNDSVPNHILSSQVACLNHLFAIRNDREVVLQLARLFAGDDIVDVLPMGCDKSHPFIAFEVTSAADHLNERTTSRGANCTSLDAAILAKKPDGSNLLIPIEWKYTEGKEYNIDRSDPEGSGAVRIRRYSDLIDSSKQLKKIPDGYLHTVYFVEPFYQLMRQTLWAEQIVKHKATEKIKADDFLHIHVIPNENKTLLNRRYRYSEKGLEETWRSLLTDQTKYKRITPAEIVDIISGFNRFENFVHYLSVRYDYK